MSEKMNDIDNSEYLDLPHTHYCLGTMDPKCDGCQKQRNWLNMQDLPQEVRISFQRNMTTVNTHCIDIGYPHYEKT